VTWHNIPLLAWDLETTGVDVETARIVTAAAVDWKPSLTADTLPGHARLWLADPGIDIPIEATKVHGITTQRARAEGRPAAEVVDENATTLATALAEGIPLVIMNARYDLTVLDRECRRHGLPTLEERLGHPIGPVIDPLVLDKAADKFRPGSRRLEALAEHYGVTLTDAHTADADALAAVQVAVAIGEKFEQLQVAADRVHAWQIRWAAEQAASFQAYRRRTEPGAVIVGDWPLIPYRDELAVAREQLDAFRRVVVGHVAKSLTSGDLTSWRLACDLAKELDGAGVNVDEAVGRHLEAQGLDARAAWLPPAEVLDDAKQPSKAPL